MKRWLELLIAVGLICVDACASHFKCDFKPQTPKEDVK